MTKTSEAVTAELSALIEEERAALVGGELDKLETLMERKEAMVSALSTLQLDAKTVAPLREGLRYNTELYEQSLAGLRNVSERISLFNRLRKSMDTYTAEGHKKAVGVDESHRLERRA